MAHWTSPDLTALTSSALVSKVYTLALLLASLTDWTAVSANGAPRVITLSMLLSDCSLAAIVERTEGMLVPVTYRFSVWPPDRPDLTPAQRASRATWPCSWTTHSTCLRPSWLRRWPAIWPARFSSWPKYIMAPTCCQLSRPELKATTGILALLAFCTAPASASGLDRVMAMPLTLLSMAFWTRVDCLAASGSLE